MATALAAVTGPALKRGSLTTEPPGAAAAAAAGLLPPRDPLR